MMLAHSRTVTYHGRAVTFPSLPDQDRFLDNLAENGWDKRLFRFLREYVDRETVYLDLGGWIGASPYWAAHSAKRVIAVDADPACAAIMSQMQRLNPSLPVTVLHAAVSNDPALILHAVGGYGRSLTSAVNTGGEAFTVRGISIRELVAMTDCAPLCIKIDVEGYEYHLTSQLRDIPPDRTAAVLISIHPAFYAARLGNGIRSRLRTALATLRIVRAMRGFRLKNPRALLSSLGSILLRPRIKFSDLIFVPR